MVDLARMTQDSCELAQHLGHRFTREVLPDLVFDLCSLSSG